MKNKKRFQDKTKFRFFVSCLQRLKRLHDEELVTNNNKKKNDIN